MNTHDENLLALFFYKYPKTGFTDQLSAEREAAERQRNEQKEKIDQLIFELDESRGQIEELNQRLDVSTKEWYDVQDNYREDCSIANTNK